ncbi:MAG: hypothetical protein N4A74_01320 [Carboxylicivirga sp.]|jgi:hypothetical protein|nr:hypothetical protein [Carboxylicivirga sp.]
MNRHIEILENMLKEVAILEKKGLDTSSLKMFIKNYKTFLMLNEEVITGQAELSYEKKLEVIKSFLEDKKAFPRIKDVIEFANIELQLSFKDQKVSRDVTIGRIIYRIERNPELKEILKDAVLKIRNKKVHTNNKTKKDLITAETFNRWAEIIKNI